MNMSRKMVKSVSMETDYPDLDFSKLILQLTYDDNKRLTKLSGGIEDKVEDVLSYQYSGNTMKIVRYNDPPMEISLDGNEKISSIQFNGNQSIDLSYDSDDRLIALETEGYVFNYHWKGNDLYAFSPMGISADDPLGFFFEPSEFLAPVNGVDMNVLIRLCAYEIGFGEILEDFYGTEGEDYELLFILLPGMIGKRSEHVLAIRIDDITIPISGNLSSFMRHDAEFKAGDSWQKFDRNIYNNWPYGPGTFEIRCSAIPYQYISKPWTWVSEDGLILNRATFPITFNLASCTGELVASNYDYDCDGVISPWEVGFKIQNINLTPIDTSEEYSVNFTFDYY